MKILKRMFFVAASFLFMTWAGAAESDGAVNSLSTSMPKLFYDFTTRNDDGTLKDLSGNGHDGHLSGSFTAVEHDGRRGLFFNGKDTKIVPEDAAGLKVTGRLSIYLKVRIMPEWGRQMQAFSPLIFGAVDGLGAHRNYSLFFDHGNQLSFDIGNGASTFTLAVTDIADGRLHSFVFTVTSGSVLAYCDGQCVMRQDGVNVQPDKNIGLPEIQLGSWFAGYFMGELYELALYDRSLSNREVLALSGVEDEHGGECHGTFSFQHSDLLRRLFWVLACEDVPPSASALEALVDGAAVWRKEVEDEELADERLGVAAEVDTAKLAPGRHDLEIRLLDHDGNALFRQAEALEVWVVEKPEMYLNDLGVTDEVLPPWTPVEVRLRGDRTEVAVWNRTYTFGDEPLACEFFSGAELSAAVSGYRLSIDGSEQRLASRKLQVVERTPSKVTLLQAAESDAAELTATHTIEYDGFGRIQVKLTAKRDLTVNRLHFIYPLNRKYIKATLRTLNEEAAIQGTQSYAFLPVLFMGDEERGLSYLADSDQYWFPVNNPKAVELKPAADGATVVFEMHPVDVDVALKAGESLEYEFALTATPIRPMPESAWVKRCVNIRPYCGELSCTVDQRGGKSIFDYYADAGMRSFIIWRNGKAFGYPPLPGTAYSDGVKSLVATAHERGMLAFPYAVGFLYSELAPEWNEARLFTNTPRRDFSAAGDFLEKETGFPQHTWETCNNKYYQNLMLYRIREAILETGMDGVYLDGTVNAKKCTDELHGCGYIDREGRRRGTYNGFANREFLKRLHTLMYQLKGDRGVVDLHMSVTYNAPAAGWATSLWSGENLVADPYAFRALPPLRFRMAYTGANIGVPSELLHFTMNTGYRAAAALAMVHGVPVRPHDAEDIDDIAALWRQRERLGLDEAHFIGYWKEECPVVAKTPGVYVSCYLRQDGSVVAMVVSNLTAERQTVELSARREGLAVPAPFELDSQDFRILELGR